MDVSRTPGIQCYCRGKAGLGIIQGCYREERLKKTLPDPKMKVNCCLPPITHATNAARLSIRDKYNHYCMSGDLQLRTETLAPSSTCKAACHVNSQPVPCMILQLTPTCWLNMGLSPMVGRWSPWDSLCTGLVLPALH